MGASVSTSGKKGKAVLPPVADDEVLIWGVVHKREVSEHFAWFSGALVLQPHRGAVCHSASDSLFVVPVLSHSPTAMLTQVTELRLQNPASLHISKIERSLYRKLFKSFVMYRL
jgi:hypothetical protein